LTAGLTLAAANPVIAHWLQSNALAGRIAELVSFARKACLIIRRHSSAGECPMNNEDLIRKLIKGSNHRAIQESAAALLVLIAFGAILQHSAVGSPRYYGCLLILVGTGFIAGVVWSFALSYQLLRTHSASDTSFWREAFYSQAKLLRLVPLWYCAPICAGGILFVAPTAPEEFLPYLIMTAVFALVFAGITWINRRAAAQIDNHALQLV
jgi:hypothetical protein